MRGPLVGRGIDAVEHARRGLARQCQRGNRRQLAHFQILARTPEVALDAAFHKRNQAILHARAFGAGDHEALVNALRHGRQVKQMRSQRIAAAADRSVLGREVVGQAVTVQIVGQLGHGAAPELGIVHADGLAGGLLQAGVGIAGPPVAHAGQTFGQLGHQRHLHSATAWQGICGRIHGHAIAAVDLHQRGLLHRQRHGGHDALTDLERILRRIGTASGVARGNLPDQRLGTRSGELGRSLHIPGHFTRLACGNLHVLGLELQHGGTRRDLHLHGLGRGVAQRDLSAELIVLAHQRRQAADDLQILRGTDRRLASAEQAHARIGHGHHLEGGQGVVERHLDQRHAVAVQHHIGLPQQQGV